VSEITVTDHPINLINNDDLKRSRLTVFFRLLLLIPHAVVLYLWGIAAGIAVILAWIVGIFTGRIPDGLHNFMASYVRYQTRVTAYGLILANPFPPFGGSGTYPVDVEIAPSEKQSRLTIFFRLLLAIPALILAYVFLLGLEIVAFFGWIVSVVMGKMPQGLENLGTYLLRWETQSRAYTMLLTGRYPSLSGIG
jgi:hypothetical protein